MERIIIIGHGSPLKEANNLRIVGRFLHNILHPMCDKECVRVAYLQFERPDLRECIEDALRDGVKRIIIHPYFLSKGMHVTKDIPEIIEEARGRYPHLEFLYTEPLGFHEKLIEIIRERIEGVRFKTPHDIERRSFEIISELNAEIGSDRVDPHQEIIKRVIHATADLEFRDTMLFSPDAIKTGIEAIRLGKDILVDVEMIRAGISKDHLREFGIQVHCHISDEDVRRLSEETGQTRAEIGIQKGLKNGTGIVVIGNAPTALLKVIEILRDSYPERLSPPILVIGVPVGFVNALESKILLSGQGFPFITNLSRKGGTPVAVAIVNALLKIAREVKR